MIWVEAVVTYHECICYGAIVLVLLMLRMLLVLLMLRMLLMRRHGSARWQRGN